MKKFTKSVVSLSLAATLALGVMPIQNVVKAQDAVVEVNKPHAVIEKENIIPFARWSSGGDPINKINDGLIQYNPDPANRWTDWKPSDQLKENWVGFVFGSSVDVREAEVSEVNIDFYNDHGVYLPKEYKVQYFTGKLNEKNLPEKYGFAENSILDNDENWTNVDVKEYPKAKSFGTTVLKFKPVKTKAIRILMQADQKSLGLTELKVKGELTDKAIIKRDLTDEELKVEINNLDKLGDNAKDFIGKIGSQTNNSLLEAAKNANEYMRELENLPLPEKPELPELKAPIYGGWFRTWHDQNSDPLEDRPNYFGDIPREVDLAFVFHDWTKPYSEFWKKLALEYVPQMNARGQRVIRTIGIKTIYSDMKDENGNYFKNTTEGNKAKAKYIVDTIVNRYGLDGIDVDIEYHDRHYYGEKEEQGIEIMKEMSRLLKQDGKIFMIDTNMSGTQKILTGIYDFSDYVLLQAYGQYSNESLDNKWSIFKNYIKPEKFILGFSFYEERDTNRWGDISDKVEGSAAERYAKWQPENGKNGKKAGLIGYAIDRDGVAMYDDSIKTTTYELSKQLKRIMEFEDVEDEIAEINKLTLLTSQEKDMYERWLKDGLNSKEALLPSDIVKLAK
ncbi:EndoS/ChiA family endoglycosidase, partial [Helcococcus bovis]|uniref:EndoS/ChiA family endoglycosidase n=1 Tax=Helcococcus bovis TaxID=3153252 RepID=UPI0038BD7A21